MNILVLATTYKNSANKDIYEACKRRGHNVIFKDPNRLSILISNTNIGYDRIYEENDGKYERLITSNINAIIPRIGNNLEHGLSILRHLNINQGIYSVQCSESLLNAADKLRTIQLCSSKGIRTPSTIYGKFTNNTESYLKQIGKPPYVFKLLHGSQGLGVSLFDSVISAKSNIQSYSKTGAKFLLQEFIKKKHEYRVIVVGDDIAASYEKISNSLDFRNNLSSGNCYGVGVDISLQDKLFCLRAAKSIGLKFCGVDFMKDVNGNNYLIEINGNMGWKAARITGKDIAEEVIKFIEMDYQFKRKEKLSYDSRKAFSKLEEENTELTHKLFRANEKSKIIFINNYLNHILEKSIGKELKYTDRDGNRKTKKISRMFDIAEIMVETFKIK